MFVINTCVCGFTLVGLSSPLPAHATLSPAAARTFTAGLPHVNYSLPMAPLFDSVAHLTQGFAAASQSPYRAAMQGVPGQTVYAIDPASHPVSTAARFAASIVAASAVSEPSLLSQKPGGSLFNTDSQTMTDAVVSPAASQSLSSSSQAAVWNRVSGHTAPAHPYAGLPADFAAAAAGGSNRFAGKSSGAGEPPPAHSGSRPNTNSRGTAYQTKEYTPALVVQQPPHLASQTQNTARRESAHAAYPAVEQSNPPTAHLHLQRPGDDLMQKLLQTYGTQRSLERIQMSSGGRASVSTYSQSPPVAAPPSVSAGRSTGQVYVDPVRSQRTGATVAYSAYGINSPLAYASSATYPVAPADNGMEDLNYDDVSSPEGMGLQEAAVAAAAAGAYQQIDAGGAGSAAGKVLSHNLPCSAQRPPSAAIGRPTHDPTIQAQADSTTRPKKCSGGSRGNRAVQSDTGSDRGARRNRSNSARSRGSKGKIDDDESVVSATAGTVQELNSYGTPAYAQLLPAEFGSTGPSYLSADSFPQYRVAADPYQLTECMLAASRPDVGQRLTAAGDAGGRAETSAQQEAQVFMTNMFGNTFVNPNELLTVDQIAFVDPSDAVGYTIQSLQKPDMQKPRPIIDEEFGHLSTDPTLGTEHASVVDAMCSANTDASDAGEVSKQSVADQKKADTGFIDSFMHFVQGKKPETLASVSTSVITKKPILPKYIPEPPRPKPPPPPPPVTVTSSSSVSVKELPAFTAAKTTTSAAAATAAAVKPKNNKMMSSNNKITVQFSDDDEDDEPLAGRHAKLSSMVNRAITSLDVMSNNAAQTSTAKGYVGKRGRTPKNTGNVQKPTAPTAKPEAEKQKHGDTKTKKSSKVTRGKMLEVEPVTDDDDEVLLVEPVAVRQKSTRKAKEKGVQKQRSFPQTTRKR